MGGTKEATCVWMLTKSFECLWRLNFTYAMLGTKVVEGWGVGGACLVVNVLLPQNNS